MAWSGRKVEVRGDFNVGDDFGVVHHGGGRRTWKPVNADVVVARAIWRSSRCAQRPLTNDVVCVLSDSGVAAREFVGPWDFFHQHVRF